MWSFIDFRDFERTRTQPNLHVSVVDLMRAPHATKAAMNSNCDRPLCEGANGCQGAKHMAYKKGFINLPSNTINTINTTNHKSLQSSQLDALYKDPPPSTWSTR
jgi:hypothetical protein